MILSMVRVRVIWMCVGKWFVPVPMAMYCVERHRVVMRIQVMLVM